MDVVYRFRANGGGEELKYSLRSLKNIPHDNVWIVGDSLSWMDRVNVIRTPQTGPSKWYNSRQNVITACLTKEISEDFIMMDDDFFIIRSIDGIPVWHRGPAARIIERYRSRKTKSNYIIGLVETVELLRWAGVTDEIYAYNIHIPMVINKTKMLECLGFAKSLKPRTVPQCFHLRSWYGNYWQLGGEEHQDVKIRRATDRLPDGPFVSTQNSLFTGSSSVRTALRDLFPDPSPYEGKRNGPNFYRRPRGSGWSRTYF